MRLGGVLRGEFGVLVRAARFVELRAELFEFRVQHRIAEHSLAAFDKARVLFLQLFERAIGFRQPPRNILPRLNRRRVFRLQFCEKFFPVADVRLKAGIDRVALFLELVALDDQRRQLLFERAALLAQRARELLAIVEDGVALAVEIRRGLRVLALEFIELGANFRKLRPRHLARVQRRLEFVDLILLRLHRLFERSDARLGFLHPRLVLQTLLLRLLLEVDLLLLERPERGGLLVLQLANFRDVGLRLRLDFFGFRLRGVAFEHEKFQPLAIAFDFLFEPLDGPRVERRHFVGGRVRLRDARFEIGDAFARVFEFGADDAVLVLKLGGSLLEILERLADFHLLLLRLGLDFLSHLGLRTLHVECGVLLALVGGGEKFFRLGTRVLFPREFQRRLALRAFHRLDAALQFLHRAIVLALRPVRVNRRARCHGLAGFVRKIRRAPVGNFRDLRGEIVFLLEQRIALGLEFGDPVGIAKLRDLALEPFDFLMPLGKFLLHLLALAHGFLREIFSERDGGASLGDFVGGVVQILAEIFSLRGCVVAGLDESLALARQFGELPLVVAPDQRHTPLDIEREVADFRSLQHRRIFDAGFGFDLGSFRGLDWRGCRSLSQKHRGPERHALGGLLRRGPRKP